MPCQILCDGTWQKNPEARSGLSLAPSHCTSLHNIQYGIKLCYQINHSKVLEDVIEYIFDSYCNTEMG